MTDVIHSPQDEHQTLEGITIWLSLALLAAALALIIGFVTRAEFSATPSHGGKAQTTVTTISPAEQPLEHAKQARLRQLTERFDQAVAMLHAKQYDYAVTALHRVLELDPKLPEAHVNMGFALLGLEKYKAAGDFFASAIALKPYQANAYWGLAVALEKLGDKEAALGAMRSYLHLAKQDDPYVRKARSALWEWESEIKRGPLPKPEQDWIDRRTKEQDDRNSPVVDMPPGSKPIDLLSQSVN